MYREIYHLLSFNFAVRFLYTRKDLTVNVQRNISLVVVLFC